MPRFIVERSVGTITPDLLKTMGRRSNDAVAEAEGVIWIRSYVSEANGKIYCEYDAPSVEAILEVSRRAGIPADRVSEISIEVNPEMFH